MDTESIECENCRQLEDEITYLNRELDAIDDREQEIYSLECELSDKENEISNLELELDRWKGHSIDYYMLRDLAEQLVGKTKQDIVDILKEYRIDEL